MERPDPWFARAWSSRVAHLLKSNPLRLAENIILVEQLRLILGNFRKSLPALLVAALLLRSLSNDGNKEFLWLWCAAVILSNLNLRRYARQHLAAGIPLAHARRITMALGMLNASDGLIWSMLPWLTLDTASQSGFILVIAIYAGLLGGVMATHSPVPLMFVAFAIPEVIATTTKLWLLDYHTLSIAAFLYFASLLAQAFNSARSALAAIMVRFELAESHANLQVYSREIEDLYDNAPCGYHSIDADGRIVKINQTELDWLGYSRDEMIGKSEMDFLTPASQQAVQDDFDAFKKVGHILGAEREMVRKDGTVFPVQLNSTAIYDEDGNFLMSRSIVTDITERKKAEEVLRIAGVAFESQEGMMVTDAHANIIRVNHAFTEIAGYSAADAIGKNPKMLSSGRQDADFYKSMWKTIHQKGHWSGEIWNRKKSGEIYPEQLTITAVKDDAGRITNYVGSMLDITDRKISEAQIQQLAYYDHLTGLPNRRLFHDRLEQDMKRMMRNNSLLALLFIDLDKFKDVNDTLGHDKGDILLIEAAKRIRKHVRETDTFARLGGDEFTIILPECSERSSIDRVVQNVLKELEKPFDLGDGNMGHISGSIGIALYPLEANDIDELLKHAD